MAADRKVTAPKKAPQLRAWPQREVRVPPSNRGKLKGCAAGIEPLGFNVIELDGYLTDAVVAEVRRVVDDAGYRNAMVEPKVALGRRYFS